MDGVSRSPLPQDVKQVLKPEAQKLFLDFPAAIVEIINGKKVTRFEWEEPKIYGFLNKDILSIHKLDGKNYQWIVNDGDLLGKDWYVV